MIDIETEDSSNLRKAIHWMRKSGVNTLEDLRNWDFCVSDGRVDRNRITGYDLVLKTVKDLFFTVK